MTAHLPFAALGQDCEGEMAALMTTGYALWGETPWQADAVPRSPACSLSWRRVS
jgi:hypothetical protein